MNIIKFNHIFSKVFNSIMLRVLQAASNDGGSNYLQKRYRNSKITGLLRIKNTNKKTEKCGKMIKNRED